MGTDQRFLARVEVPLEERAENRRLDVGPVGAVDGSQDVDFRLGERHHVVVGEQSAVEVGDHFGTEITAVGHRPEEVFEFPREHRRVGLGGLQEAAEELRRQQSDPLAEHAKHELHQEVGRPLGRHALPHSQPLGQVAEPLGGVPGDRLRADIGPQGVRLGKQFPQDVQIGRLGQPGQVELVFPLGRGREVGMDLEAVHVADDQQRRILQVLAVAKELVVGFLQVFVLAFVFPAEVAAHPHVGPAVAAFGLLNALLESVPLALGVGFGRLGLVEQFAEVEEVLLAGAPLREVHALPLGDELLRSHSIEDEWKGEKRVFCSANCAGVNRK